MTESQNKAILDYLKNGNSITAIEALEMFGCFRLSARIGEIKWQLIGTGKKIEKQMIKVNSGKRVAKYFLIGV